MKLTRRALIKASLASPVVLSITPAQGQTAASSAQACIARDASRFNSQRTSVLAPPALVVADNDDWLRVRVDVFSFSVVPSGGLPTGAYYVGYNNNYWRLAAAPSGGFTGGFTGGDTGVPQSTLGYTPSSPPVAPFPVIVYGLAYLNSAGVVVGTAAAVNGGAAVTGSCVASALPGGIAVAGPLAGASDRRQAASVAWRRKQ